MPRAFVDTEVVVRLLTGDDPAKQQAAHQLFGRVEQGELELCAPITMIADAVYVLSSPRLYHVPRADVRDMLVTLMRLPNLKLENKMSVVGALELFGATTLDFGDALIIASMRQAGVETLYAFDLDFDHHEGIVRVEPTV